MNKKGFTLIELLAVIVILAIIALIATPIVLGMIENAKKSSAEDSAYGYLDTLEKRIAMSDIDEDKYPSVFEKNKTYNVGESELNSLNVKGTTPTSGTVTIGSNGAVETATLCINEFTIEYVNHKAKSIGKCNDKKYKDGILNGADPVIGTNMIPVTIANDGTVKYADINNEWYDYSNKEWANAVKLSSGTYKVGDTIPESAIESYFVWIPRYKYKIFNIGNYTSHIIGTPTSSIKQTIDIVFESKDKAISNGSIVNSYLTHPAFTTLDTNGIWVGKYETGYNGAVTTATAQILSTDSTKIIVKPNVYNWRGNTIYNIFLSNYNYDRTNDSHMMKNTEWGAVAYLSHSNYGINKEVNINNNSSFKTGYSALTTTYGDGATYNQPYNTTTGYLASTTGNITGIYDMSGGAWEYMASYMSGQLGSSGYNTTNISIYNSKYFDIYSASSTLTSYNNRILGDAIGEIGPFYYYADSDTAVRLHNSWYGDNSEFITSTTPWFIRGCSYNGGVLAGQFNFARGTGAVNNYVGSRLVLTT